jgi:tRNA-splicing ligase RtcB
MPIKKRIEKTKVPIYVYTDDIEASALDQAIEAANKMPIHHHLALMPDVHTGYGLPIGGVMPLVNAISPHAVGYDIGCGMLAVRTSLTDIDLETQKNIFAEIRHTIPVGFNHRKECIEWELFEPNSLPDCPVVKKEIDSARHQLGTLGGGNHFIELQKGDDGNIWFMIHSGSRNLGHKICTYYDRLAKTEGCADIKDLAYFSMVSELGFQYSNAMEYALQFALENREVMANLILNILGRYLDFTVTLSLNVHHNYATYEKHFGQSVMVHRKGATLADVDYTGIIPGSQGAASYIVEGLGNPDSFNSCSHGAGRVMSRKQAKKTLNADEVAQTMAENNILWDKNRGGLDEAPQAYKDIDTVIANQSDLVMPMVKLMPYQISAIKG